MIRPQKSSLLGGLHWPLIFVVLFIGLLGVYNLHSAAASQSGTLYISQLFWLGLGSFFIAVSLLVDYRVTEMLAYPLYTGIIALLLLVQVAGRTVMGARRWLSFGPLNFQPSELTKVAIIFCLARYFAARPQHHGYALRELLRPLSPTRPLLVLGLLLWGFNKPALVDPMGELARGVYHKLEGIPVQVEPLLWFRVFVITSIFLSLILAMVFIVRLERLSQLLHPWPPKRRRRLLTGAFSAAALMMLALAFFWQHPFVLDPIAVTLQALAQSGAPTGRWAEPQVTWLPRLILLGLGLGYMCLSAWVSLARREPWLDVWLAPIDLLAVPAILVLIQPDLGTAGIIGLIGMTMVLVVGVRGRSLVLMAALGAVTSLVAWFGVLKDYQKRRILTFIDPEQDVRGAGWNAVQSLIAVGSGRWVGKGHRNGTQTQLSFLPEQHTDFAFSVWAEEQGFLGGALLVGLYLMLAWLALRIAAQARDTYGMLVATGATALIVWQAAINIGMVTGVLPVVGITLPLFSYGGSSALVVLSAVGLLLNVNLRRR